MQWPAPFQTVSPYVALQQLWRLKWHGVLPTSVGPYAYGTALPWLVLCSWTTRSLLAIQVAAAECHRQWLPDKLTAVSSGDWESQDQGPVWSTEDTPPGQTALVSSHGEEARELCSVFFIIRALIPLIGAPPSWPNHLSEAPPPNFLTLGTRFGHMYKFGETQIFSSRVAILF